jgi:FG-GAP repeat
MRHICRYLIVFLTVSVPAAFVAAPALAQGMAVGDFNGDGRRDLAVGVPDEDITVAGVALADAGAVNVLYGGVAAGLSGRGSEFLHEGAADVAGAAEANDRFGHALASGDFNGDGYDDLAVGVPGQAVGGDAGAGAVHVFYGSSMGLVGLSLFGGTLVNDVVWHRDSGSVLETADPGDNFGWALAVGNFNGDKYDDLAIGVPFDDVNDMDAGSVHVLHGWSSGLVAADRAGTTGVNEDDQVWHEDVGDIDMVTEPADYFGWSVAAGDFNDDGFADLAVGAPGESVDGGMNVDPQGAGAVLTLRGSSAGLTDAGREKWHQATPTLAGLADTAEVGDAFGYALAVGDFDGNGCDDLAIGVPLEDDNSRSLAVFWDVGAVHVIYGFPGGGALSYAGAQFWHQDTQTGAGAMGDSREPGDAFGLTLAAGDLNGDGYADLVVGVPNEDFGSASNAGAINVLYGSGKGGLSLAETEFWHQDTAGVTDTAEGDDFFSRSLAIGDFNGDTYADLAIGVPGEGITSLGAFREHAGAVAVLHGSSRNLTASDDGATAGTNENDQFWHQNSTDVADTNERHDHFGGGGVVP